MRIYSLFICEKWWDLINFCECKRILVITHDRWKGPILNFTFSILNFVNDKLAANRLTWTLLTPTWALFKQTRELCAFSDDQNTHWLIDNFSLFILLCKIYWHLLSHHIFNQFCTQRHKHEDFGVSSKWQTRLCWWGWSVLHASLIVVVRALW